MTIFPHYTIGSAQTITNNATINSRTTNNNSNKMNFMYTAKKEAEVLSLHVQAFDIKTSVFVVIYYPLTPTVQ